MPASFAVGNLSASTLARSSASCDLRPIFAGRFRTGLGIEVQPVTNAARPAANKTDVNRNPRRCPLNRVPCDCLPIMPLLQTYGSKRFCSNHSLGLFGFLGSSGENIDVSQEDFGASSFEGLIQGLVGVVDCFFGADFLKLSVLPILLKNFFVPVVILFNAEGCGLLGFDGTFFVSVLLSENSFGIDNPSPIAGKTPRSKLNTKANAKMRAIRTIISSLFDLLLRKIWIGSVPKITGNV